MTDQIEHAEHDPPMKGDVIEIVRGTRARFQPPAVKGSVGDVGVIVSEWVNYAGTRKFCIVKEDMTEVYTTENSVKKVFAPSDSQHWLKVKMRWMDQTYVPVILSHTKNFNGGPKTKSRAKGSYLLTALNGSQVWLSKSFCHPSDWKVISESDDLCVSARIPQWLAIKSKLIGVGDKNG